MAKDLSEFLDFMEEVAPDDTPGATGAGFRSPPMPSPTHPEGVSYLIEAPSAVIGLKLAALADITIKASRGGEVTQVDVKRLRLDDQDETEFLEMCLGSAYHQMLADDVRWPHMKRLGMYAFLFFGISEEAADAAAAKGLFSGKAPAPTNRAARRSGTKKTSSASVGSRTTRTPRPS